MPNWGQILNELQTSGSTHDIIRRKYLKKLSKLTKRNVIVYYSGWLQKPNIVGSGINDGDKIGFMSTINGLDRSKGLDLILHTPGGSLSATESIVQYLREMFGTNIRAIVPQIAMSAGTMLACSCKSILMGKHSNLGPIDPQISGIAANAIIEEFTRAFEEIQQNPTKLAVWRPILEKYNPTLIGECQRTIQWSQEVVKEWLTSGMFIDDPQREQVVNTIVEELGSHPNTRSHDRHLSARFCREKGLKIEFLEDSQLLQDAVLSVHHACIHTLSHTDAFKLIENHNGISFIQMAKLVQKSL